MTNEDMAAKVAEHDTRIKCVEGDISEIKDNIKIVNDKVEDIHRISINMERISSDVGYIKTDLSEVKENQKDLSATQSEMKEKLADVEVQSDIKKSKLFDDFLSKIWWLIIGGAIAYLLTQAFPNIFT
jgi:chromosome segregation ATPase